MNNSLIRNIIGKILILGAIFMVLPLIIAIIYFKEDGSSLNILLVLLFQWLFK